MLIEAFESLKPSGLQGPKGKDLMVFVFLLVGFHSRVSWRTHKTTEKKRGKKGRETKTYLDLAAGESSRIQWRAQNESSISLFCPRSNGGESLKLLLKTLRSTFWGMPD